MANWYSNELCPPINERELADFCLTTTEEEIAGLEQNGADGIFATDNYIGLKFTLTNSTPKLSAGKYEYSGEGFAPEFSVDGATITTPYDFPLGCDRCYR